MHEYGSVARTRQLRTADDWSSNRRESVMAAGKHACRLVLALVGLCSGPVGWVAYAQAQQQVSDSGGTSSSGELGHSPLAVMSDLCWLPHNSPDLLEEELNSSQLGAFLADGSAAQEPGPIRLEFTLRPVPDHA